MKFTAEIYDYIFESFKNKEFDNDYACASMYFEKEGKDGEIRVSNHKDAGNGNVVTSVLVVDQNSSWQLKEYCRQNSSWLIVINLEFCEDFGDAKKVIDVAIEKAIKDFEANAEDEEE